MIEKKDGKYIAKLVVDSSVVKSAADLRDGTWQFIAGELSRDVYDSKPINVEVVDGSFKPLKTYYSKPF